VNPVCALDVVLFSWLCLMIVSFYLTWEMTMAGQPRPRWWRCIIATHDVCSSTVLKRLEIANCHAVN
jgi:hypothetical protein